MGCTAVISVFTLVIFVIHVFVHLTIFKNNYLNNIKFLQEINKCTLKDKLLLFKSLIYKYQINLNNKINIYYYFIITYIFTYKP